MALCFIPVHLIHKRQTARSGYGLNLIDHPNSNKALIKIPREYGAHYDLESFDGAYSSKEEAIEEFERVAKGHDVYGESFVLIECYTYKNIIRQLIKSSFCS